MADDQSQSVTRDYTVNSAFVDRFRGILPACIHCNRPSAYRDLDGNWSHAICAGEGSEEKRAAKVAARGGKIAPNAGMRDLDGLMSELEKRSAGRRAYSCD
jgi:hypothetical protein